MRKKTRVKKFYVFVLIYKANINEIHAACMYNIVTLYPYLIVWVKRP